jgi:hypothetical protein
MSPPSPLIGDLVLRQAVPRSQRLYVDPGFLERCVDVVAELFAFTGLKADLAGALVLVIDLVQGQYETLHQAEEVRVRGGDERMQLVLEDGQGGVRADPERLRPQHGSVGTIRGQRSLRERGRLLLDLLLPLIARPWDHEAMIGPRQDTRTPTVVSGG